MVTTDGKKSIVVTVVLSIFATFLVALRVWVRSKAQYIGADDWLLVGGVIVLCLQDVGAILRK
jgi:hypothetical protein